MSEPEEDFTNDETPIRPRRRRRAVLAAPPPAPEPEPAPRRRRRMRYAAPPAAVRVLVVWKNGKTEAFEGADAQLTREYVVLSSVTPDYRTSTSYIPVENARFFRIERPWQPPTSRPMDPSLFDQMRSLPAEVQVPAAPPQSVMHVSPGMATRKPGAGRTLVTPDGMTATQTPEGDIVGAALFAAGMPPGRIG